ncbi:MAG: hypothetical protein GC200_09795 [Tepidisphaera sp.]|nr:hypothetical protein [Tepidisphaera sp.]
MNTNRCGAAMIAALVLFAGGAVAQPGPGQPPPQREPGDGAPPPPRDDAGPRDDGPPRDPERAKKWVERMLKETRSRESRLQEALDRLNKGEAPDEILRDMTDRMGEGAGPDDGGRRGPLAQRLRDRARGDRAERGDRGGRPGGDDMAPDDDGPGGRGSPGPGGRDGPPGKPGERLTPEHRQEIEAFVKENMPVLARRLEMAGEDRGERGRMLERLAPRIEDAMAAKRRDPELFECREQEIQSGLVVFDAVKAYRDAAKADGPDHDSKVKDATDKLRDALNNAMAARDKVREREIDLLAKRIEKMRSELEKQKADREKKVDGELKKIQKFGPRDGPPPPPRPGDDDVGR